MNQLKTKFMAYVGGFGSGKTFTGCLYMLVWMGKYPGTTCAYFGVTYQSITDVFYSTFEEAATMLGFTIDINIGRKEISIFRDGIYYGMILCRTLDKPEKIIGYKVSLAMVDELDTLPKAKALLAWNKIIARLRLEIKDVINKIIVTTTPEGYGFVYDMFKDEPTESYSMVQASTYENAANLPADYISSLYETYPKELIEAYINGDFVNLNSGTVYSSFDRKINSSNETVQGDEDLFVGMDFNVNKMAAVVFVKRYDDKNELSVHIVDEIMMLENTEATCTELRRRYKTNKITVYPDSSGKNTKSSTMKGASASDLAVIMDRKNGFGFKCIYDSANPRVKNRIMSCNKAFENLKCFINPKKAKLTIKSVEQQIYVNSEPDKKSDTDHPVDAMGYFLVKMFPIIKPIRKIKVGYAA
jgi:phage terminase large subunit